LLKKNNNNLLYSFYKWKSNQRDKRKRYGVS